MAPLPYNAGAVVEQRIEELAQLSAGRTAGLSSVPKQPFPGSATPRFSLPGCKLGSPAPVQAQNGQIRAALQDLDQQYGVPRSTSVMLLYRTPNTSKPDDLSPVTDSTSTATEGSTRESSSTTSAAVKKELRKGRTAPCVRGATRSGSAKRWKVRRT